MRMIRTFFLLGIVCVLVACAGNETLPTSNHEKIQNAGTGYLEGIVTIGPLCPVESVEDPCQPDPSLYRSHKLVILGPGGETVKQVEISEAGNYRTELIAGNYTVDFAPHDIGIPGSFEPPQAVIRENETTILNIEIDTGIR